MTSLNQVTLLGYLGKDPEALKVTKQGSFVRLSLATTKKYQTAKQEFKEDIQWHTVYVNNHLGKAALEYLHKGSRVYVSGELRNQAWQNKETQARQFATGVYAAEIIFLDGKPEKQSSKDA